MNPTLDHKHLIVRAEVNAPPLFRDRQKIDDEMKSLIKAIDMNILSGPHTAWSDKDGNEGYSSVAIIDTSSITLHSWTTGVIQLDVYSCKPFAIKKVFMWLAQFEIEKLDYKFIDRNNGFKNIDDNELSWWDSEYYNKIEKLKKRDPFIYK